MVQVDIDARNDLATKLDVSSVPTLVLVDQGAVLDRLEGRATGREIDRFLEPHLR